MALTDYERGIRAARNHGQENGWEADGESRQFWDGFSDHMREGGFSEGPQSEGGTAL